MCVTLSLLDFAFYQNKLLPATGILDLSLQIRLECLFIGAHGRDVIYYKVVAIVIQSFACTVQSTRGVMYA